MLTAMSDKSRNQTCGQRLIRGDKLDDILQSMTVEGVPTASVAVAYAEKCGLELPIFRVCLVSLTFPCTRDLSCAF